MRFKITILLSIAIGVFSCAEKQPVSNKAMKLVMQDIMLMESGNQMKYNYGMLPDALWKRDYAFVCKKHQIDTSDFREMMAYYKRHPESFSKLMEEVITALQKIQVSKRQKVQ